MKVVLKKFIIYLVLGIISSFVLYFIVKQHDFDGSTVNRINSNKYYLIFLFLSIIVCLSIYGKNDNKSKFLMYFIIFINFLYLLFLFLRGNIGLNNIQGLLILGFLILGLTGIYIKNWFGYIIIGLSIIGSLFILFFSIVPLYNEGPDFEGFEKNFNETLLIYSNIGIDENNAQIIKDNKKYLINNGLNNYILKIGNNGSQIVFKSDVLYENTYCFIVFKGGDFVEILPQSAININENFEIEILTGNIKYYPGDYNEFSFVGDFKPNIENSKNIISIVKNWYDENFVIYIKNQLGSEIFENKTILKISKKTLGILSKLFPGKYEKNLKNLQDYIDIFGINLDEKKEYENNVTTKGVVNGVWGGIKKGLNSVD